MSLKLGHRDCFVFILSIFFLTNLAILLNISFLRQIFGFLFLTFLPGLLILQLLKLNKIDSTEKFVLSVGLSISFLMFFGLLINNLSLTLGYKTPLSTIPLLISFNIAFIILAIIGYKTNKDPIFSLPNLNLSTAEKAFLIVPVIFPALSIFGMHLMNTTDNNIVLMFLLFLIPIYVIFVCFLNQKFSKRLYPVVIFLISISLLLLLSLRGEYIFGMDIHEEFHFFKTTLNDLHWHIQGYNTLNACLSISILPTVYKTIANIRPMFLYKILYSLIFSITPLVIYIIAKKYIEEGYAFLAACFFMFQHTFLDAEYNPRTSLAILFFALVMMILFDDKIDLMKKRILLIVFIASCLVSHYTTTYILYFIMLGAFIGMEIHGMKYRFKKVLSLMTVILFFAMIFSWYSQITRSSFDNGVYFIRNTFNDLFTFAIEESRGGGGVESMLGAEIAQKGIPHQIEFVWTWLTFAFIGIGLITLILRYREMSFPELGFKKLEFLKDKFEVTYFVIALLCVGLLIVVVAVPYIARGYSLGRVFMAAITILSVFFVIGGIIISKSLSFIKQTFKKSLIKNSFLKEEHLIKKQKDVGKAVIGKGEKNTSRAWAYLIILLVLIPYFLCVTGVMYNLFGVPRAIILNSEGDRYDNGYIYNQEVIATRWLCEHGPKEPKIYDDGRGFKSIWLGFDKIRDRFFFSQDKRIEDGYIYLRHKNVMEGKVYSKYSHQFVGRDLTYNNGGSEIWS